MNGMCHQCDKIDLKIAHFKEMSHSVEDPQSVRSIELLIAEMGARKDALHPERKP